LNLLKSISGSGNVLLVSEVRHIRVMVHVALLLLLLLDGFIELLFSLLVDHLPKGSRQDVKLVSLPVLDGSSDQDELVLLVEDGLSPVSELLEENALLGSHEVVTQLPVGLVTSELLLLQDLLLLLLIVLIHATDELVSPVDAISDTVLDLAQLILIPESGVLSPDLHSSLLLVAVHLVQDLVPVPVSQLVAVLVEAPGIETSLHQLHVVLVPDAVGTLHVPDVQRIFVVPLQIQVEGLTK